MIDDNTYQWVSRLGHVYRVEITPVLEDLPDPMTEADREPAPEPEPHGPNPDRGDYGRPWQESASWDDTPPPAPAKDPEPQAPPKPTLPPELDIPPF
jgi:hypothetical protein